MADLVIYTIKVQAVYTRRDGKKVSRTIEMVQTSDSKLVDQVLDLIDHRDAKDVKDTK